MAKATDEEVKGIMSRLGKLRSNRSTLDATLQEVAELCVPMHDEITQTRMMGEDRSSDIFDSTAFIANVERASFLYGLLVNPETKYQSMTPQKHGGVAPSQQVARWLEGCNEEIMDIRKNHDSGFYEAMLKLLYDGGPFGIGALIVLPDDELGCFYRYFTYADFYFDVDYKNKPNAIWLLQRMTLENAALKHGLENLSVEAQRKYKMNPNEMINITQCVKQRVDRDTAKLDNLNMAYMSIHIEDDTKHVIAESGFTWFPPVIFREICPSRSIYPLSAGMTALASIRQLQFQAESRTLFADLSMHPPRWVYNDGLFGDSFNLTPDGMNVLNPVPGVNGPPIGTLEVGGDIRISLEDEQDKRKVIERAFMIPDIEQLSKANMSATEATYVYDRVIRKASPIIRLYQSGLTRVTDNEMMILSKNGRLQPPPDELFEGMQPDHTGMLRSRRAPYRVNFDSPVSRADKAEKIQSMQLFLGFIGQMAQFKQDAPDKVNTDEVTNELRELIGIPTSVIMDDEIVNQVRTGRAQQQQAQATADQGAKIVAAAAKAQQSGLLGYINDRAPVV